MQASHASLEERGRTMARRLKDAGLRDQDVGGVGAKAAAIAEAFSKMTSASKPPEGWPAPSEGVAFTTQVRAPPHLPSPPGASNLSV